MSEELTVHTLANELKHESRWREKGDQELHQEIEKLKRLKVVEIVCLILVGVIISHVPKLIPVVVEWIAGYVA